MSLTDLQREKRKQYLGSSDVAALFNVSPFPDENSYKLWLEKSGKLEPQEKDKPWLKLGSALEPAILSLAEDELGKLTRRGTERKVKGLRLLSHIDAIVEKSKEPVEAKTVSLFSNLPWGDPATPNDVPDHVILQCEVHMMATGMDVCHVPVYLARRGFACYTVTADPEIFERIGEKVTAFWDSIQKDIPPENVQVSYAIAKRMKREPGSLVKLSEEGAFALSAYQAAKTAKRLYEGKEKEALAAVLQIMGENEAGQYPGMGTLWFRTENAGVKLDTKKLKAEYPDVWEACSYKATRKVPRFIPETKEIETEEEDG